MKKIMLITVLALSFSSAAFAKENTSADAESADTACATDAATAGCTGKKIGTGLRICMHQYKKAHPTFEVSATCKAAIAKMKADHEGR